MPKKQVVGISSCRIVKISFQNDPKGQINYCEEDTKVGKAKKILLVSLVLVFCLYLLAGCTPEEKPIVIRLGGTVTDEHPGTQRDYKFKELFEAATDGAYEVQVYTNCALGSPLEMIEAVKLGNLEITGTGSMVLASFTDKLTFMDIPFLFPNGDVAEAFCDGDVAQGLYDRIAEETGIRCVGPLYIGAMTLMNNVRPIRTPDDLKGIKFRVQETPMYLKYFETMGGSPMPMALSEVFTAAQQGTIDGLTTQNAVFYSSKFHEVIEHISDVDPYCSVAFNYVSETWLKSLPDDIRTIFYECAKEACEYVRPLMRENIDEVDEKLETLCTITHLTDEERAAFVSSADFMIDFFKETVGDPHLDEYLAEIKRIENLTN